MKSPIRVPESEGVDRGGQSRGPVPWKASLCWVLVAAMALFVLVMAEKDGPASPENANSAGAGQTSPVLPLLHPFDWILWGQVAGALLAAGIVIASVVAWRRRPGHPVVLMVLASSTLLWWDPINNWSIGLVYNPNLWHFPREWPWFNISPVIEPLTSFVYAPYVLLPYFLAMPILRRFQRRSENTAFASRHPLIVLALLTFVIGVIWDAAQEILLTRAQFLTYSHAVDFGTIDAGKNSQFPLLMASVLITVIMIPTSILLYRDDTGKSQAEKVAQRLGLYARHPKMATFLVMTLVLNIAMISFSSAFWLARTTDAASTVACPWPYPHAKIWDPRGHYEAQGAPGPFTAGNAASWQIRQPDGRPTHTTVESDRCNPQ